MKPAEERPYSTTFFMEQMREKCKNISGPSSVSFEEISGGPPTGKPISVKVQGKYLDEIKAAALVLQDSLKTFKGAYDVSDDFPPGKKEVRIVVDEDKAALYGFNAQYVAANVRYAFDGVTATEYRDGDDEVDVIVKFGQKDRSSLDDILYLKMTNTRGETVALREMVKFIIKPGPTEIKRIDRKRTIFVTGNINEEMTTIDKINNKLQTIFPEIEQNNPGINFKIGGQFEEFLSVFNDILPLFALGMIIIFFILGTQFNSYAQPLLILTTVPFSLIGAMLGLLISGNPFSIIAMFGFVALAGVVVNDAIVMIDFINNRRKGKETSVYMYWKSIINSGRLRLRPIILTSLTTISGLVPMAFGIGGISEMWSPLANVILFGLLISTGLTLLVIPSFMAILDDIQGKRKKALN
jgi:multidrug efflux pump subunit AcrB